MSELDVVSAVRPVDGPSEDGAGGGGIAWYETELAASWSIVGALNGGYLQVPLSRAALAESPFDSAVAMTVDFMSAPKAGPARLAVRPTKVGRTAAFYRVELIQGGRTALSASVVTSALTPDAQPLVSRRKPPVLPDPDDCRRAPNEVAGFPLDLMREVEVRFNPDSARSLLRPDGSFEVAGWFRLVDGGPVDQYACLVAVDALPPVTQTLPDLMGWAPTVQLTTYLRAIPADGWLRAHSTGTMLSDGWFDEECAVFDSTDQLVAQSRQLARAPRTADA